VVSWVLSSRFIGRLEYLLRPQRRSSFGGPFNGQKGRIDIFNSIMANIKPSFLVETGAFRGTTTRFMAESSKLPVFTVECNPRNFGFASQNLWSLRNVHLEQGDSRCFLRKIFLAKNLSAGPAFVYLDAHWFDDLPLADELKIIFSSQECAVVLVDDFEVPDDDGYGYDDYGPGKALTTDYLEALRVRFGLALFFPSLSADDETGAKRGCVVIASDPDLVACLRQLPILREWEPAPWIVILQQR
jgi:hypothetical protein